MRLTNGLLEQLTLRELLVVYQRYHKGKTLKQIAILCDAPLMTIHRVHNSARRKLTKGIEKLLENSKGEIEAKQLYYKHLLPQAFRDEYGNRK